MATFEDTQQRTWSVAINVSTIKRVKEMLGIDLLEFTDADKNLLLRLAADPVMLVDVLYVTCKPQADELGISDIKFGEAMAGDVIEAATRVFLEELANFTPNPRDRQRMHRALGKLNGWLEKTHDVLDRKLDDPRLDQKVDSALAKLGDSFTSAPESAASTPDR